MSQLSESGASHGWQQENLTHAKALIFRAMVAVPAVLLKYDLSSVGPGSSLSKDCKPLLVLPSFSFRDLKKLGLLVLGLSPTSFSENFWGFPLVFANLGMEKPDMVPVSLELDVRALSKQRIELLPASVRTSEVGTVEKAVRN